MKTYPLLQPQLGVFLECMSNPEMTKYNLPSLVPFSSKVDADRLETALHRIVNAHPEMRLRFFIDDNGTPMQYIDEEMKISVVRHTMSETDAKDYIDNKFVQPYNLTSGEPLWRLEIVETPERNYLLCDVHHTIGDGMSLSPIMTGSLPKAYYDEPLEEGSYGLVDYAMDEQASFETEAYQRAKNYYAEKFAGVDFLSLSNNTSSPWGDCIRESAFIDQQTVDAWCKEHGTTSNLLFMAAFSHVMSQISREEKVAYYTINHGRMDKRLLNAFGMFVKSTPILADVNPKQKVMDFIKSFRSELMSTIRYGIYPFNHFCRDLHMTPSISFGFQGVAIQENLLIEGETIFATQLPKGKSDADLSCIIFLCDDRYDIRLEASDALYERKILRHFADSILAVTQCMMENPDALLCDVFIVTEEQKAELMRISAGKHLDIDITKTFASAFVERAKLCPDAPAVVDAWSQFTYAELDRNSNILAHILISNGVQPNSFVCVMLDRKKEYPLSALAIHKVGAAYTPLDLEYPNERLSYMIENSQSKVLVTTHDVLAAKCAEGELEVGDTHIIYIDDIDFDDDSLSAEPINLTTPQNLAYMIYTSGSTGKPKGAMLHQGGLWNLINAVIDVAKLTHTDRIEGHRSFSFDAHIEDMYSILTVGGSFHIMPAEIRKDLQSIRDFIIEHKITGGGYSTAIGTLLLNSFEDLPIRYIGLGGEKLEGVHNDHIEIINEYGPTECTVDTSFYTIKPGVRIENIPIGKPVANTWNFIVSPTGQLVPPGMPGELCIAGIQVGRGYWQLPERTAQAFCDCPFVAEDAWGRKVHMYHTGDLCRWNERGEIEYLGRIDFQVKLRGFRIELGEIESKALSMEGIRQAVADVRKINGIDHLLLYYTQEANATLSDSDIRKVLEGSSLAEYMIPDTYVELEAMPLTPNGKVDRKRLKSLAVNISVQTDYVAPTNEVEKALCDVFASVLEQERVGINDNYAQLGGDSLRAMEVQQKFNKTYADRNWGVLSVSMINLGQTPKKIAELLTKAGDYVFEEMEDYPLNTSQMAYAVAAIARPTEPVGVGANVYRLDDSIDLPRFAAAFEAVTRAHKAFGIRIIEKQPGVYRQKYVAAPVRIQPEQMDQQQFAQTVERLSAPMVMLDSPLYRIRIIETTDGKYLLVAMHHTIIDGTSNAVLMRDLSLAYDGHPIPEEEWSQLEVAQIEQQFKQSDKGAVGSKWVSDSLKDIPLSAPQQLLTDDVTQAAIKTFTLQITPEELQLAAENMSATLNVYTTTIFARLIGKYIGRNKVAVWLPYASRDDYRTQNTVGQLANGFILNTSWEEGGSLRQHLEDTNRYFATAMSYIYADKPRISLNDMTSFLYQGEKRNAMIGGSRLQTLVTDRKAPVLPMPLQVHMHLDYTENNQGKVTAMVIYHANRYTEDFIQCMINDFSDMLKQV